MKVRNSTLVILGLALFFLASVLAMVIPEMLQSRKRQISIQTVTDLKMLTLSARIYAQDNDDTLPNADKWCDQLISTPNTNSEPPLDPWYLDKFLNRKQCSYAINSMVAGRKLETLSSNDIVFLPVTKRGRNLSTSPQETDDLTWDAKGTLEVVDLASSRCKLERPRAKKD